MDMQAGSVFTIGLTGGIASGKSAAEAVFVQLGITVVDADRVARKLVEPGQPALAEIVRHFGADILDADGRLNRPPCASRFLPTLRNAPRWKPSCIRASVQKSGNTAWQRPRLT